MPGLDSSSMNADGRQAIAGPLAGVARRGPPPALDRAFPLLLALADDEPAAASIRMALTLAHAKGAMPTVVRALGDVREAEAFAPPLAGVVVEEYLGPDYVNECRDAVKTQLSSVAGEVEWPLEVTDQSPIDAIVERARGLTAGLIVMGLRHHGVLRRVITRDLLAEVVRVARIPVLAVRPDGGALPRRVVVAVDFGAASIRAAQLARALLANDGAMWLVHVSPDNSDAVREQLQRIIDDLAAAPGMTMTPIFLHGDVQSSIEGCAQAVDADLLAVGSETHSLLDRLTTGRISMKLAHTARWSTLIVPTPSAIPA